MFLPSQVCEHEKMRLAFGLHLIYQNESFWTVLGKFSAGGSIAFLIAAHQVPILKMKNKNT